MQSGEIQAITFSGCLPNFKSMWLFREVTSAILVFFIKDYWFHVAKVKASSGSRPLGLLLATCTLGGGGGRGEADLKV